MARRKRTRRKTNARRRVYRRRTVRAANPPRRRRRTYRRRSNARRRTYRRRRNPDFMGMRLSGSQMAQAVLGGLVGVAAAKFIPTAIPNIGLGQGNVVRVLMTGVSAFLAGYAAEKAVGKPFGSAVLFGGLMQTGSVALNAFLPSIGSQLGLSGYRRRGMGDLVNTRGLVVPYNPVMAPLAPPAAPNVRIGTEGLTRAFGNAF